MFSRARQLLERMAPADAWVGEELELPPCPICEADRTEAHFEPAPRRFRFRCSVCGFQVTAPTPDACADTFRNWRTRSLEDVQVSIPVAAIFDDGAVQFPEAES